MHTFSTRSSFAARCAADASSSSASKVWSRHACAEPRKAEKRNRGDGEQKRLDAHHSPIVRRSRRGDNSQNAHSSNPIGWLMALAIVCPGAMVIMSL